ncbi:hypothetical protein ASC93_20995 [Massilia sp. Root335]|nr:hypothetical protein ASC93_20995 [Massilia sp. Root335]
MVPAKSAPVLVTTGRPGKPGSGMPPVWVPVAPALVRVRVWPPSSTAPEPDSDWICAPLSVAAMSKTPLSFTPLDRAMLPEPASASVPPMLTLVAPL